MPNRLARETSPYLLQHRDNPVDWHPWGEEALSRARSEDKPILLSIGYSACHWCHVMERECFEDPGIARLMNESFVCVKVDREERPDLDQIYQNVAQAITRSGGWPLTVFLTPELKPFFGGTYYPPEDRYGRPGFPQVLTALAEAYRSDRAGVAENARRLTELIGVLERAGDEGPVEGPIDGQGAGRLAGPGRGSPPDRAGIEAASRELLRAVDWENGGLGGAPKFPNPMMLEFLWRFGAAAGSDSSMAAALLTATKMASGGIHDQLGGGFHRYSVDETWSVPHFEKMLYDNGLLLGLYARILLSGSGRVTEAHRELFLDVVSRGVEYLLREMVSPEGAFYAAQDADSEGEEGRYFVWSPGDLQALLTESEARAFSLRHGVSENGNFEHGRTVLCLARGRDEIARILGEDEKRVEELLDSASAKLLSARSGRIPPATDTQVLASWNGLAISGLAWASRALRAAGREQAGSRAWDAAVRAFETIRSRLSRDGDRLFSTLQQGQPKLNAYLDDYAFLSLAALDLARFESDPLRLDGWLGQAEAWIGVVLAHFKDPAGPGFFFTSDDHEALIHRPKSIQDQAIPSGTGVVIHCLLALAEIDRSGRGGEFAREAEAGLRAFFPGITRRPEGHGELLSASLLQLMGPVVVSGAGASELCHHAHLFQKSDAGRPGLLVCHRRVCGMPSGPPQAVKDSVGLKLRI